MRKIYILINGIVLLVMFFCSKKTTPPENSIPFTFEKSSQNFQYLRTNQIALGDLDNDGDLDAVFSNMGFNYSQVWFNDGNGYFTDSGQQLTQQGHGVVIGDLDNDGDADIFITCTGYRENESDPWSYKKSSIYLNDGSGNFQDTGQDLGDEELSGNAVHIHDMDNDNDPDILVYYYGTPNKIYLNDGTGQFTEMTNTFPDYSVFGDLNSDGSIDIFTIELGQGFKTMLNDGSANFTDCWTGTNHDLIRCFSALGDVDNDGDIDVLITNGDRTASFPTAVLLNDGTGNFMDSGQNLFSAKTGRVGLGDFNNDGYLDAVITSYQYSNQVWLNDGAGGFVYEGIKLMDNNAYQQPAIGDLDNDGDLDIFLANYMDGSNEIWFNRYY